MSAKQYTFTKRYMRIISDGNYKIGIAVDDLQEISQRQVIIDGHKVSPDKYIFIDAGTSNLEISHTDLDLAGVTSLLDQPVTVMNPDEIGGIKKICFNGVNTNIDVERVINSFIKIEAITGIVFDDNETLEQMKNKLDNVGCKYSIYETGTYYNIYIMGTYKHVNMISVSTYKDVSYKDGVYKINIGISKTTGIIEIKELKVFLTSMTTANTKLVYKYVVSTLTGSIVLDTATVTDIMINMEL